MKNNRVFVNDLVSVITPVYNSEKFIEKTILSVFEQTYQKVEMVIIDDCSKDKTVEVVKDLRSKNSNIVFLKQNENMGAAVARNTALMLAKGRYVAFLDADDLWKPEKIAKQIELMQQTGSPFCYTSIEMINQEGVIIKTKRLIRTNIDYNFLLHNTMIATSTVIIDRTVLGDFRMPLRRGGQDYATWLLLLRNEIVAVGIDEALCQYRISPGSLSSNKLKNIKQVWDIQVKQEKIKKCRVLLNIVCYLLNAVKKYYF